MKKGTSIVLLTIISVLMAFMLVMTFVRFPVGTIKNYNSVLGAIELDHGMEKSVVYTLTLDADSDIPSDEEMDDVLQTLNYRFTELGYENTTIKKVLNAESNVYDVRVEINPDINEYYEPDTEVIGSVVDTAIKYGALEFYCGTTSSDVNDELFAEIANPIENVTNVGYNELSNSYGVMVKFSQDAYDEIVTKMSEGDFFLKVMLGEETLLNASEALTESYFMDNSISFNASSDEMADQMVLQIKSGGLDFKFTKSDVAFVNNYLGDNVALVSIIAVGALIILAMAALIIVNKGIGIASALSLLAYMLVYLAMFIAVPGVKLSIGGVIGMALATVLAVDGMIVTSKRVQEELSSGKTIKSAIRAGFKRSLVPNLSGGIASVVLALLLFAFTKAEVRAFAISFGIGAVIACLASILAVRLFVAILLPLVKNKEAFLNAKKEEM